jgi:quinol-cytochrome oxidoreductase complex cytochrome b subunit
MDEIYGALMTYTEAYAEKPSVWFLSFMIFPLIFIFLVRYLDRHAEPIKQEQTAFWYSTILLILSMLFFPYITYRFAMAAIAIQVFMATKASNVSVRSGISIAGVLMVNFIIYALFSKSVIPLFYG